MVELKTGMIIRRKALWYSRYIEILQFAADKDKDLIAEFEMLKNK